jgi:hypothetical protein
VEELEALARPLVAGVKPTIRVPICWPTHRFV